MTMTKMMRMKVMRGLCWRVVIRDGGRKTKIKETQLGRWWGRRTLGGVITLKNSRYISLLLNDCCESIVKLTSLLSGHLCTFRYFNFAVPTYSSNCAVSTLTTHVFSTTYSFSISEAFYNYIYFCFLITPYYFCSPHMS